MNGFGRRAVVACLVTAFAALLAPLGANAKLRSGTGAKHPPVTAASANPLVLTATTQIDPRLVQLTMRTPAISGAVHVRVLLPAGYATSKTRYPVIYLLHGSTGNASTWTTSPYDAEAMTAGMPAIIVMPDGGANGEYTNWVNDGKGGPPAWETFHIDELVPWIDAHYRTIAKRQDRAITGVSMGGLGTMEYASRHPDIFGVAASMSGAVSTASQVGLASIEVNEQTYGSSPLGTIYGPYGSDDLNYRAHSPTDLAMNLSNSQVWLSTYNGVPGSSCQVTGDADVILEQGVHEMTLELDAAMNRVGVAHVFHDLGAGTHSIGCFNHQLSLVLPWIMNAFAHPQPTPSAITYTTDLASYTTWGWSVNIDRAVNEFSTLVNASAGGFTLEGSGSATVTTPADYTPGTRYRVTVDPSTAGESGASGPELGCDTSALAADAASVSCASTAAEPPNAVSTPWTQATTATTTTATVAADGTLTMAVPLGASNTVQEFGNESNSATKIYRTQVTMTQIPAARRLHRVQSVRTAAVTDTCSGQHWIGAWEAAPSDSSQGSMVEDQFAASEVVGAGDKKLPVDDQTIRTTLTPSYGGSTLRIHLSNRFGSAPITFTHVTVGTQQSGATLNGAPAEVTFGGQMSVTVPAGQDIISDPVQLSFAAMQTLDVSVFVAGDAGLPTEHYIGRQTTYYTADGAGDHSTDVDDTAFVALANSARPFVDEIDVMAPDRVGTVVAFGDSITDGFQAETSQGIPAAAPGFDLNERWPDYLTRRLIASDMPLAVVNAGISGNRILQDGVTGGGPDIYGPSALSRLAQDVLSVPGATTVIWLEGINDIGQSPTASAAQIEAGYVQGIDAMHAAGLKVLMGTITPTGGDTAASYGGPAAIAEWQQINQWIKTESPADGVVDFNAAIADPSDPTHTAPAYAGADDLHPDPAGYQAMGNAVDLAQLRLAACAQGPIQVHITPGAAVAHHRLALRITVTSGGQPVPRATVTINGRHTRFTPENGVVAFTLGFHHAGRYTVSASALGYRPGSTTITIAKAAKRRG